MPLDTENVQDGSTPLTLMKKNRGGGKDRERVVPDHDRRQGIQGLLPLEWGRTPSVEASRGSTCERPGRARPVNDPGARSFY